MTEYDILVVGAGHNALVAAGYLAQAGYKIGIIERRHMVGGAVVTEEHVPGFKFDLGGSAHILINHTPIVDDLRLRDYGLEYLRVDPIFYAPFPDGTSITIWQDVEKTCASIAEVSPEDAEAYRQFIERWTRFSSAMVDSFLEPPTLWNTFRHMVINAGVWRNPLMYIPMMSRGYGRILRRTFKSEKVQAVVGWMAGQSGPPPNEMLAAPIALWHPMYHVSGVKRPVGGSGALTQALARMIEANGGEIFTSNPAKRFIVSGKRVVGVETSDGQKLLAKKAVISGAHIRTTMALLGDEAPPSARKRANNAHIDNGMGMIVRYAMSELPAYTAAGGRTTPGPEHQGLQFICPSLDYLDRAYADFKKGIPSREPALAIMTVSAVDPTLAPPGQHVMYLWGQYFPYKLASGEHWDEVGKREGDRMLAHMATYAPNVQDAVIGELIETPLYLERELGLIQGHIMHLEMRGDQMFFLRPALGMGVYRGPLEGLYLTGASTHPGGGIMGAAGRNAATVVRQDLERGGWFG